VIGEDAETIVSELGEYAPWSKAATMFDAVQLSAKIAEAGDLVLLAPACASFDMFESFEHRGRVFKEAVRQLSTSHAAGN
jgi:UDP-N-acetylmuramoylalanine--D-glutamate ligase